MKLLRFSITYAFLILLMFSFGAVVYVRPARAAYSVNIWAWDSQYGWLSEPITMNGVSTNLRTPQVFNLTGPATFSVPTYNTISNYQHQFEAWYDGTVYTNSYTLTVSAAGNYTAQYYPSLYGSVTTSADIIDLGQSVVCTAHPMGGTGTYTSYIWFVWSPTAGSKYYTTTAPTFTFTPTSAGSYSINIEVHDSVGGISPWSATNGVTVNPPPTVSISPTSATMDLGQSQNFRAYFSGGSGSYSSAQWYVNGVAQSGAVQSIFSFTPGSVGSYSVTATVSDSLGATSAQSSQAGVIVNPVLTAGISPTAWNADWGYNGQFSASVSGGTPPFTYQWYVGGSPVSGATGTTHLFGSAPFFPQSGGSTTIYCRVSDSASSPNTIQTNTAPITIYPALYLSSSNISASSTSLEQGQSSTLTAPGGTGGLPPYTYKWSQKPAGVSYYSWIDGVTSSTYVFATSSSTATGSWMFNVLVFDSTGASGSNVAYVSVAVSAGPTVSVSPASAALNVGQSKSFTAIPTAGSGIYPSYKWYVNGVVQVGNTGSTFTYSPSSAGSPSITATVTDSVGVTSPQSSAPSVIVNPALTAPTVTSAQNNITQGQATSLTASTVTTGTSPYSYQWFSMSPGASSYSPISSATSTSYSFATSNTTSTGTWTFMLQVTDNTGATVSNTVTLNVGASIPEFSANIMLAALLMTLSIIAAVMNRKSRKQTPTAP